MICTSGEGADTLVTWEDAEQQRLTRIMRKTFRAAVTDAWIFLMFPGSPALMNMQAYCGTRSRGRHVNSQGGCQLSASSARQLWLADGRAVYALASSVHLGHL